MKKRQNKAVLTSKEAAAYLGISVPILKGLLGGSVIPSRRTGQRRLSSKAVLDDWLITDTEKHKGGANHG